MTALAITAAGYGQERRIVFMARKDHSHEDQLRTACFLIEIGRLPPHYVEVWNRNVKGESILSLRSHFGNKTARTLRIWAQRVREALDCEYEGRDRNEIPCHQGSDVLEKSDKTPQSIGIKSSWDTDGMAAWGKRPRY